MLKRLHGKIKLGLEIIKYTKNWPIVFMNYFGIFQKESTPFKFRSGLKLKLRNIKNKGDTSGLATIWEIIIRKNYNPKDMKIKNGDIIIDIGANIGIFSMYASIKNPKGKIYSYEPFKIHYKRFLDNIRINKIKNIFPENLAVCGKKGKRDLFINENSSGMHSVIFDKNSKNKIQINCTTLKDIFEKNKIKECNFLKIDCEGAEYEIIYSIPKNILNKISKIALEFDNIDKEKNNCFYLRTFLENYGFKVIIRGEDQHQGILYAKRN